MNLKKHQLIRVTINIWRIICAWLCVRSSLEKDKIEKDFAAYKKNIKLSPQIGNLTQFGHLLLEEKSFRNVILMRLKRSPIQYFIFRLLFKPLESLYINMPTENIGGGYSFNMVFQQLLLLNPSGRTVG